MPDDISRDQFIPPPGTSEADRRRQSFGAQADAYTKFRPGYPPEVFDYLLGLVNGTGDPPDVVDVADLPGHEFDHGDEFAVRDHRLTTAAGGQG